MMKSERTFWLVILMAIILSILFVSMASAEVVGGPVLGGGLTIGDGFQQWNIQNSGDQANAYFNIEFKHPMLNYADWSFNVRQDDTSLWSAQLYMSGPITTEKLLMASSISQNTSVNKGGVQLSEILNLDCWHSEWDDSNTMMLSGSFSLSPAAIVKSYFNYDEYPSYDWNGEEWVEEKDPSYWYAVMGLDGKFLDTPTATGQMLGAAFSGQPVPEPSTFMLMVIGFIAAIWCKRYV